MSTAENTKYYSEIYTALRTAIGDKNPLCYESMQEVIDTIQRPSSITEEEYQESIADAKQMGKFMNEAIRESTFDRSDNTGPDWNDMDTRVDG